jgi:hypothetical protein
MQASPARRSAGTCPRTISSRGRPSRCALVGAPPAGQADQVTSDTQHAGHHRHQTAISQTIRSGSAIRCLRHRGCELRLCVGGHRRDSLLIDPGLRHDQIWIDLSAPTAVPADVLLRVPSGPNLSCRRGAPPGCRPTSILSCALAKFRRRRKTPPPPSRPTRTTQLAGEEAGNRRLPRQHEQQWCGSFPGRPLAGKVGEHALASLASCERVSPASKARREHVEKEMAESRRKGAKACRRAMERRSSPAPMDVRIKPGERVAGCSDVAAHHRAARGFGSER